MKNRHTGVAGQGTVWGQAPSLNPLSRGRVDQPSTPNSSFRDRRNEVLFIDARQLGHMISRTQRNFSDDDIQKIASTYHAWRQAAPAPSSSAYADVPGFCMSASLDEIRKYNHNHVLTPGRYVGAAEEEVNTEPFEKKMKRLTAELAGQFEDSDRLEKTIKANLKELGYGR